MKQLFRVKDRQTKNKKSPVEQGEGDCGKEKLLKCVQKMQTQQGSSFSGRLVDILNKQRDLIKSHRLKIHYN